MYDLFQYECDLPNPMCEMWSDDRYREFLKEYIENMTHSYHLHHFSFTDRTASDVLKYVNRLLTVSDGKLSLWYGI